MIELDFTNKLGALFEILATWMDYPKPFVTCDTPWYVFFSVLDAIFGSDHDADYNNQH